MRDEAPVWKVQKAISVCLEKKEDSLKHFMPREGHNQICILKSVQTVVEKTVWVRCGRPDGRPRGETEVGRPV